MSLAPVLFWRSLNRCGTGLDWNRIAGSLALLAGASVLTASSTGFLLGLLFALVTAALLSLAARARRNKRSAVACRTVR